MSYARTFDISSYLVFLTGFSAVWLAGGVDTIVGLVTLAALAATWRWGPLALSRTVQYLVVGGLLILFLIDTLGMSGFGPSTVHLLLGLGLYKSLTRQGPSDYVVLYLVSFSLLLTASTYTLSIHFLAFLVLFLLLSVFTFMLLENRAAYQDRPQSPLPVLPYLAAAATLSALTVLLAVPIFVAVPRVALGWMDADNNRMVGFSQSVDLGEIGEILGNSQVVMRVNVDRAPERLPPGLRWRGVALDRFDGRTWSNTQPVTAELPADDKGRHLVALERRQREDLLEQIFTVEPFSDVLFAAPSAIQFAGFRSSRFRLAVNGNGAFLVRPRPLEAIRYYVHSDLRPRSSVLRQVRPEAGFPPGLPVTYRSLPPLDPRIPGLAAEVTRGYDSPALQAVRLEQYLKSTYGYTLSNPSGGAADPLADFLFSSRAGHCEYFASAHAVLLRTLGIPTRVVNGFRAGQFNQWGNYFIVRQSDAHSWVEAYLPGAGWVEFDPTPAEPPSEFTLVRWAALLFDTVDMLWGEAVTFDRWKQVGLFSRLRMGLEFQLRRSGRAITGLLEGVSGLARSPRELLIAALELTAVLAVLLLLGRFGRNLLRRLSFWWRWQYRHRSPAEAARDLYSDFQMFAAQAGLKRHPGETPGEFGSRLADALGTELPVLFTQSYYRLRFGGWEAGSSELDSAGRSLRELRRWRASRSR